MNFFSSMGSIIGLLLITLVVAVLVRAIQIVSWPRALVAERLGKFHSIMYGDLHVLIPFIDRIAARVDLREQMASFQPQPVITADNVIISIDSVIYYQVTGPMYATYEITNLIQATEWLTVTTSHNVIGPLDLEAILTGRDSINTQLRGVLDETTGRRGIRVNCVELKAIDPLPSIRHTTEQQPHTKRDKRTVILTAQGARESQTLRVEGEKQSVILCAEGQTQAAIACIKGKAEAINAVFTSIYEGEPTPDLLSYQYLRVLPEVVKGNASEAQVVPTELVAVLGVITKGFKDSDENQN